MANEKPAHGTFCWNELVSRDMPAAEKFYSELLGWKPVDSGMPGLKYTMWKTGAGEKDAGGLMEMPADVPEHVPSHWMSYIAVEEVDNLAKKAKDLGAEILHGPEDIPNVGRFVIVQDPTGAAISFIKLEG